MAKIIWILLDGLSREAAINHMCYPAALCEAGQARQYPLLSLLPPLSRPAYATWLTGLAPLDHGILRNDAACPLSQPTIFDIARSAGLSTCAAAYHWFFELCCESPFEPHHRHWHNPASAICHGIFYFDDSYPDGELFADGAALIQQYRPDLMLVHGMGIDRAGHCHGSQSFQYGRAVESADDLLAQYCPLWLAEGYNIVIGGDHGMDAEGGHHSTSTAARETICWLLGPDWPDVDKLAQTDMAPLMAKCLGLGKWDQR